MFHTEVWVFPKKGREQGWQFVHYGAKEHIVWSWEQRGPGPGAQGVPAASLPQMEQPLFSTCRER